VTAFPSFYRGCVIALLLAAAFWAFLIALVRAITD
jgi:hypothetical protein